MIKTGYAFYFGLFGEEILVVEVARTDAVEAKSRAVDSLSVGNNVEIRIQYEKMPERPRRGELRVNYRHPLKCCSETK